MHCKQKTTTEKYNKYTGVLPKEYLSTYKRIHITLQKGIFQKAKGCLLDCERAHIMLQKDIF